MALAWFMAVIVNVIVWAHRVYLDYPAGSIQDSLNTAIQPLTYAIVLPSAISIYSLSMTVARVGLRRPRRGQVAIPAASSFPAGVSTKLGAMQGG